MGANNKDFRVLAVLALLAVVVFLTRCRSESSSSLAELTPTLTPAPTAKPLPPRNDRIVKEMEINNQNILEVGLAEDKFFRSFWHGDVTYDEVWCVLTSPKTGPFEKNFWFAARLGTYWDFYPVFAKDDVGVATFRSRGCSIDINTYMAPVVNTPTLEPTPISIPQLADQKLSLDNRLYGVVWFTFDEDRLEFHKDAEGYTYIVEDILWAHGPTVRPIVVKSPTEFWFTDESHSESVNIGYGGEDEKLELNENPLRLNYLGFDFEPINAWNTDNIPSYGKTEFESSVYGNLWADTEGCHARFEVDKDGFTLLSHDRIDKPQERIHFWVAGEDRIAVISDKGRISDKYVGRAYFIEKSEKVNGVTQRDFVIDLGVIKLPLHKLYRDKDGNYPLSCN